MQSVVLIASFAAVMFCPAHAMAYVGPGLGAGTISVVLGIFGSINIALFALLWYPFKRLVKKMKPLKREKGSADQQGA